MNIGSLAIGDYSDVEGYINAEVIVGIKLDLYETYRCEVFL